MFVAELNVLNFVDLVSYPRTWAAVFTSDLNTWIQSFTYFSWKFKNCDMGIIYVVIGLEIGIDIRLEENNSYGSPPPPTVPFNRKFVCVYVYELFWLVSALVERMNYSKTSIKYALC